jgi:hypothetical protein
MTRTPPITAADLDLTVTMATDALNGVLDQDWRVPAGSGLEWSCRETVQHIADGLFLYGEQLGSGHPDAPALTLPAGSATGNPRLVEIIEVCGTFLSSLVTTAPPGTRAQHVFGLADPEGFAAMGVMETLVHMNDVAAVLGIDWAPPDDLCGRVLYRLFPDAPAGAQGWETLLWVTGRAELAGRARLTDWRWRSAPREA